MILPVSEPCCDGGHRASMRAVDLAALMKRVIVPLRAVLLANSNALFRHDSRKCMKDLGAERCYPTSGSPK